MPSKIITISIPETMHRHVKKRVSSDDYSSVSEYFRELIRHDQRTQPQPMIDRPRLASAARRSVEPYAGRRY